ncbi:uncharacterized protein MELLADRAFT_65602 [Melampsora larici-populina 98AG31]|uniref:Alpha-type protein kinase domain-containing protein n=1 Tax=Melampsora larici-populina (strain 98AG31 / pathotype 3-4-7) TaxID=747676 RepID=F4RW12_MELLP|nr:uncharacterized protein MELLADRAFT_65602 [Melampsora larici-populina 98AG31]EGG03455.1 hypothetical protein MELLADRAFT_65602 [Melampsora larici-populina 98AG31]
MSKSRVPNSSFPSGVGGVNNIELIDLTGSDLDPSSDESMLNGNSIILISSSDPHEIDDVDNSMKSFTMTGSSVLRHTHDEEGDSTRSSNAEIVPYYERIEDLSRKEEGCLYRLKAKPLRETALFYDQYEDITVLEDRVGYRCFQKPTFDLDSDHWTIRYIYLNHREVSGWYFLKYHVTWKDMDSQGRGHCFECAQSNRFAAMALRSFRHALYIKIRNAYGAINLVHQQWYSDSASLVSSGSEYHSEPRWMICEGINDGKSHRFVNETRFDNKPMEPYTWTDLIYAFVHYTYDLSDGRLLISNLDCDEHGRLTNIVCFDKNSAPHHSRDNAEVVDQIKDVFNHFEEQHRCNIVCQHLGNIPL